jgi:hypothetical protein
MIFIPHPSGGIAQSDTAMGTMSYYRPNDGTPKY